GRNGNCIPDLCSKSIDEPSESQQTDRICALKSGVDQSKLLVGPFQLVIEDRLEQRKDLPIDVVDRRREKEEGADYPAVSSHSGGRFSVGHGDAGHENNKRGK